MSGNPLQNAVSVTEFLNPAATETVPLFERLRFGILLGYNTFAPVRRGRTRVTHQTASVAFCTATAGTYRHTNSSTAFCDTTGTRQPAGDTVERFLTDLGHVTGDGLHRRIEQATTRGPLDSTYAIGSTHTETIQHNDAAPWNCDPTAERYCYGFGCTLVSTGAKTPVAVGFAQPKRADQGTAMRVTHDALVVGSVPCTVSPNCCSYRRV